MLLVTYHFAPDAAVGGLRWERHAAFLGPLGWDVDVIARDFARAEGLDQGRLRCLPDNVAIYSARESEPLIERAGRVAVRLKHRVTPTRPAGAPGVLVSTNDMRASWKQGLVRSHAALVHIAKQTQWANEAAAMGRALAVENRYDVVASSGPPHMAHEAARQIAASAHAPLVIDLRDPWAGWKQVPEDFASPLWFGHAERHERKAVRAARLVVMNTDLARDDMIARHPWSAPRLVTVRNGSDEEVVPVVPDGGRFTIRFAGTIYLDRDPRLVFRAAAAVVERLRLTPDVFRFEFIGEVAGFGGRSLLSIAAEEGLEGFVTVEGRRPRSQAMEFLGGATMLLSLPQYADLCVPAKIFEYTKFAAWVLILATPGSATARLFADSGADVVDPGDVDRMADVIASRYAEFARGGRPRPVGSDGRFERRRQVHLLAAHLEAIAPARQAAAVEEDRVSVR